MPAKPTLSVLPIVLSYVKRDMLYPMFGVLGQPLVLANSGDPEYTALSRGIREVTVDGGQWTANWNQAIKKALALFPTAKYLWLLSDDVELEPGSLQYIEDTLATLPNVGAYTLGFNSDHPTSLRRVGAGIEKVPYIEPTAAVYSVEALKAIGTWPERFVRGWGLEFWQALELRSKGYDLYVDHRRGFHHASHSTAHVTEGWSSYTENGSRELREGLLELYGQNWPALVLEGFEGHTVPQWMHP